MNGRGVFNVAREPGSKHDSWFFHIEDGWHYHLNSERNGTSYYKCVRYERGCRGRAIFDPLDGFSHTNPHNGHLQDPHYPDEMALRRSILERCRSLEYTSFHQILGEERLRYNRVVRSRVTMPRMRTAMRNARMERFPDMPQNLRGLTRILINPVHRVLTLTTDGEDNLYAGSATDVNGGHHVLFASARMLDLMRTFRVLHCDGTFKVIPAGTEAAQVLAIVGVWNSHIVPLAWALMENRTQEAYTAVLQLLSHLLGDEIELTRVITDFEEAEMNSWEEVFEVRVQGCMWHMCRRYLIVAGELGLIGFMRNIPAVRRIVRLTMALPLLPERFIRTGMLTVVHEARDEGPYVYGLVSDFLHYVYRNWVRPQRRLQRMCVYGSHQRTNNANECHNHILRRTLGLHPDTYRFIHGLVSIEQDTWDMVEALEDARRYGRARRRTSIMNDDRIRNLQEELLRPPGPINRTILRFLNAASHAMEGMVNEALH